MNTLYIGIDISSKNMVVSFLNEEGKSVIPTSTFPNNPNGWHSLSKKISSLHNFSKFICGVEATGDMHLGILHTLNAMDNVEMHELNPASVRFFARALNLSAKTDKLDSFIIALYLLRLKPPKSYQPPFIIRRLRHLSRTRRSLIENRTALKNQLHHLLRMFFPGYQSITRYSFPMSLLHILYHYPSPHLILEAGERVLMRIKIGPSHYPTRRVVKGIMRVAMGAPVRELTEGEQEVIRSIAWQIIELTRVIRVIDREIERIVEEYFPEQRLTTIPGIGKVTAGVIIGEVGDIRRFSSKKKFVGYCGLYPEVKESGEMRLRGRMTRKGNKMLKMALILASVSARRRNPQIKAYYERLRRRGKSKKVAGGAAARKLAEVVYAIMRSGEEWSMERAMEGVRRGEEMAMRHGGDERDFGGGVDRATGMSGVDTR